MSDTEVIIEEPTPIEVLVEEPESIEIVVETVEEPLVIELEGRQGPAGPPSVVPGPPGEPGVTFRGEWNSEEEYYLRDLVLYQGTVYHANGYNRNVTPPADQWDLFSPQGQHPTVNDHIAMGLVSQSAFDLHAMDSFIHDKDYLHVQTEPSTIWLINHLLGKFPSVSVTDTTGRTMIGEVYYIDENTVRIEFGAAFAGRAYLN